MITRADKIEALSRFGMFVGRDPWFAFLIGYLIGQVDRVNFLADLKDAEIAIRLSVRQTAIWPHEPFKATVRGITMPNTYTLVRSISNEDTPICLSLDFDHAEETPWYQAVLLPDVTFVKDVEEAAQANSEMLWKEMDRTLDIYREAKNRLKDADPSRHKELYYYMALAEDQMKTLSRQMEELNKHMKRLSDREQEQQD